MTNKKKYLRVPYSSIDPLAHLLTEARVEHEELHARAHEHAGRHDPRDDAEEGPLQQVHGRV